MFKPLTRARRLGSSLARGTARFGRALCAAAPATKLRILGGLCLLVPTLSVSTVEAQSWSAPEGSPALWQIVAIDRSGEPAWPYGAEDIAGDGVASFEPDEAASDLRSVYADADASRLWLRAYVAGEGEPPAAVRAYFFLNTDGRSGSGGPARGDELESALDPDPSPGGYEIALGVRGDGDLLGAWRWDAASDAWQPVAGRTPQNVRAELGSTTDPLRIGGLEHGYLQVDLDHAISTLDASCAGTIFVRLSHEGSPQRSFADDALDDFACRLPIDAYGDPVVLRSRACRSDADCPVDGRCLNGVCLFAYPCSNENDCRTSESCSAGRCVREVEGSCDGDRDCDGLVCEASSCAACSENGARACAAGLVCAPNGACLDPENLEPASGSQPGKVQGGAFSCAAIGRRDRDAARPFGWWLWFVALLWGQRRCARRRAGRSRS